jgi:hypothetical protein
MSLFLFFDRIITMKKGENLYIEILLWAYNKGQTGFTREELMEAFNLSGDLEAWIREIFFRGGDNDRPIIGRLNDHLYSLTDKGMSAAIDYIELKEARESSKRAMYIDIGSLILATIVGITQILISIDARDGSFRHLKNELKTFTKFEHERF